MLSLRELQRAAGILSGRLAGSVLQRAVQTDEQRLGLSFYKPGDTLTVLLNCEPDFARVSLLRRLPASPATPPPFLQYLRAHLGRAAFAGIRLLEGDRHAGLQFITREGTWELALSIFGNRSNIYLIDPQGRLTFAMRPLAGTREELKIGETWAAPPGKLRSAGDDRWEDLPDDSYLEAVETAYAELERKRRIEGLTRRIEQALAREESFLVRKAGNLREDLGKALHAGEHRRKGELLKSVLHKVQQGNEKVTATDFETGEDVTIPIDPRLSPAENLEDCFRRYQKDQRGVEMLRQQMAEVESALAKVESLQGRLRAMAAAAADFKDFEAFTCEPLLRRLLSRHVSARPRASAAKKPKQAKRDIPARLLPKRYRTDQGLEIWVGRSDEGNDYLTTRLARGHDLFFHLEGYPGSHVILRTEGREDPPAEAVLDACELAVHFSRLKNATRADVHVTPVKNVRKPKGAKSGLVYVSRGKTVHLRRSARRLENILASRAED